MKPWPPRSPPGLPCGCQLSPCPLLFPCKLFTCCARRNFLRQSSGCISVPLRTSPALPIGFQRKRSLHISCRPVSSTSPCGEGGVLCTCCSPCRNTLVCAPYLLREDSPAVSQWTLCCMWSVCVCVCARVHPRLQLVPQRLLAMAPLLPHLVPHHHQQPVYRFSAAAPVASRPLLWLVP